MRAYFKEEDEKEKREKERERETFLPLSGLDFHSNRFLNSRSF